MRGTDSMQACFYWYSYSYCTNTCATICDQQILKYSSLQVMQYTITPSKKDVALPIKNNAQPLGQWQQPPSPTICYITICGYKCLTVQHSDDANSPPAAPTSTDCLQCWQPTEHYSHGTTALAHYSASQQPVPPS